MGHESGGGKIVKTWVIEKEDLQVISTKGL
jgi:hypothetical protein